MSGEAEDALVALSRDLVYEIAAGLALEMSGQPAPPEEPQFAAQLNPWPPKTGAAAVHPHLGGHLITPRPGDTISGHAYAHVPRPIEPMLPDPREVKLKEQGDQLKDYKDWEGKVREYHSAARELETHAKQVIRSGKRLPPYKRSPKAANKTRKGR
jgi:hypothetical protein